MGRYRGDLGRFQNDLKIFIYDPNFPGQVKTLVPDLKNKDYYYKNSRGSRWKTYFVDMKYSPATPPRVGPQSFPADGKVRQLLLEFRTGGDDLRGGRDNVNVLVRFKDGTVQQVRNANRSARWINNYSETVPVHLQRPRRPDEIQSVELKTTFGGGIGGDNWNLDCFTVTAQIGKEKRRMFYRNGSPLVRFDGNNRPFVARTR